ncbi:MAG: C-terminal binding protein [Candidatus Omnitrophota bacterium]
MTRNKRFKVLIPDIMRPPADIEENILGDIAEVNSFSAFNSREINDELWADCDAVLAFNNMVYDPELLDKLKNVKTIVRSGIGYDNIDTAECSKRNIIVCNVPDYCTEEVADHTMAFLLALVRGFSAHSRNVRERKWERNSTIAFRLKGKVLGIIGLGRIGSAVAIRARAFGMKIVFYDPYVKEGYDKVFHAERVESLEELAGVSDIISLHAPLTQETEGMINDEFFENVKKGVVFINTARGKMVDIKALENALKNDKVLIAGLDVLPVEPSDDSQSLVLSYEKEEEWIRDRLIITPHTAFYSHEALTELRAKAAGEVKRILLGGKPRNCVNV